MKLARLHQETNRVSSEVKSMIRTHSTDKITYESLMSRLHWFMPGYTAYFYMAFWQMVDDKQIAVDEDLNVYSIY